MIHEMKSIDEVMNAFEKVLIRMPDEAKGLLSGYRWFDIWLRNHDVCLSGLVSKFAPEQSTHSQFYEKIKARMNALPA